MADASIKIPATGTSCFTLYYVTTVGEIETKKDVTNSARWVSNNPSAATVSNGRITGANKTTESAYTQVVAFYPEWQGDSRVSIDVEVDPLDMPTIELETPPSIGSAETTIRYSVTTTPPDTYVTVKCGVDTKYLHVGTFTVPINRAPSPKTYLISAWCTDYPSVSASSSVVQEKGDGTFSKIRFIDVSWKKDKDIPASGGTATKENCSYTVEGYIDGYRWEDITNSPDLTVSGEQVVNSSTETSRHEAGTLTLTANYSGLSAETEVTIYQAGASSKKTPEFYEVDLETLAEYGDYLSFNIISPGTIVWKALNTAYTTTIEYKLNDGEWTTITSNTGTSAPSISVSAGDVIQFRGNNETYSSGSSRWNTFSGSTAKFEVEGNIMSLIDSENFVTATTLASGFTFGGLFYGCTGLTSAENLLLPATILVNNCYQNMFQGCTSLVTAPKLIATTLTEGCYEYMFNGCTSLTSAPELPATTLAGNCYSYMFNGCTSLTSAENLVLPAITLVDSCYLGMFRDCTSLTSAPALPATTLAKSCYYQMFYGCISLTSAPALSATTLTEGCYQYMFNGCTNLNYIKCLATNISATNCTYNWVSGVSSTGTFVKDADMSSWTTGNNGIPNEWTVKNDEDTPLSFIIVSSGTIVWKALNTAYTTTIEYSLNDGETWTSITSNTGASAPSISVTAGDVIQFRGNNATYSSGSSRYNTFSGSTAKFEVKGNIMSLIDSENFATATTLASGYTFKHLFANCTGLTSAKNLVLPATTLALSCYYTMFYGCTSLTTAPVLPATTLANNCYYSMFYGCTSLTLAPALPVTALTSSCYSSMFQGCTSLTTAPALPATALAESCYFYMFQGCTGLTSAPVLAATTLANNCYTYMFNGCTSLTSAPELPATTLANYCYGYMFQGCTSLTSATLPATTLAQGCYRLMFDGCRNLNYIKCLATDISANDCTSYWVNNVSSAGTFVKNPNMTSWTIGRDGIPNNWTIQDA